MKLEWAVTSKSFAANIALEFIILFVNLPQVFLKEVIQAKRFFANFALKFFAAFMD